MGFDTMRSFQHLMLNSNSSLSGDEFANDDEGNKPVLSQQHNPLSEADRRRGKVWDAEIELEHACNDTVAQHNDRPAPSQSAPDFQLATANWSPPPSPKTSSCTSSSPIRVDSARLMDSPPLSPTMTTREKSKAATQLFNASCAGDTVTMLSLLAEGAPINASSLVSGLFEAFKPAKSGHLSPLAGAASRGQLDAVELLVANGAIINPTTHQSASSPLHQAIRNNDIEIAQFLLDNGADVNLNNSYHTTPLMYAIKYGSIELVALVLRHKPDVHKISVFNAAAIHWSVWPNRPEVTELLIRAGADVNHAGTAGITPLHCAVNYGSAKMVKILLVWGADPLRRNDAGETPLQLAEGKAEPPEVLELVRAAVTLRKAL